MHIVLNIVIVLLIALGPRLMVLLAHKYRFFNMLGPVFLCYALGFLFSLILPEKGVATTLSEILVPIAIPLILFSADLASVRSLAKPMLRSFLLMIVSVFAVSVAAFFAFRSLLPDAGKYAGMIIGLYTGGTPNLIAIGMALDVPDNQIVLANTVDFIVGGIYFLMLISIMPRLVRAFLPAFSGGGTAADKAALADRLARDFVPEKERFSIRSLLRRVPAVLFAVLSLAIAAGLALLLTGELSVVVVMLVVTTCGVVGSFLPVIKKCPGSFQAGQYLIYMFSLAIGLSFDLSAITGEMFAFLAMFALAQFGSVLVHLLLAKLTHTDADTALITSTAGIYGPAFIVPVADALKNPAVVLPGLICGILGYAVGNYLGIGTALLLTLVP